jgi:uncharacterized protein (TIGR00730 family)
MKNICVYCGSSFGNSPLFREATWELGKQIAQNNISLVYGGGRIGLMGVLADSVLEHNGTVTGVIPRFLLDKELGHNGLTNLIVVENMHERKMRMILETDAFVALPGGLGTLEEIFEVISWGQLLLHSKPCAFLNVEGFYDSLNTFLQSAIASGFISEVVRECVLVDSRVESILQYFNRYRHPVIDKAGIALRETMEKSEE